MIKKQVSQIRENKPSTQTINSKFRGKTIEQPTVRAGELKVTSEVTVNTLEAPKEPGVQGKLPRMLFFDVETAPVQAYVWGLYQEVRSTEMVKKDWFMLSWAAKWYRDAEIKSRGLIHYPGFLKDPENDSKLLGDLWGLLDEADFVVAHNAVKFDVKKVNTRFIMNGYPPVSPYKVIDTLLAARSAFAFTSNRLGDLCDALGVDNRKGDAGGFKTWAGCMRGDPASWETMLEYNESDVLALEDLYVKLIPYIKNHPSLAPFLALDVNTCPKCGAQEMSPTDKFVCTSVSKFAEYRCSACGGYARGRTNLLSPEERKAILVNV